MRTTIPRRAGRWCSTGTSCAWPNGRDNRNCKRGSRAVSPKYYPGVPQSCP
jgi:hypothetical protein